MYSWYIRLTNSVSLPDTMFLHNRLPIPRLCVKIVRLWFDNPCQNFLFSWMDVQWFVFLNVIRLVDLSFFSCSVVFWYVRWSISSCRRFRLKTWSDLTAVWICPNRWWMTLYNSATSTWDRSSEHSSAILKLCFIWQDFKDQYVVIHPWNLHKANDYFRKFFYFLI